MTGRFPFTAIVVTGLGLSASPALGQILGEHYLAGTEGIQAGTLPGPGVYFDDINWFGHLSEAPGPGLNGEISSYVNEPRLRWITPLKLLSADYGMELMLPWGYQQYQLTQATSFPLAPGPKPPILGFYYHYGQYELHDLEVSPLLLSWHWNHFDLTAGYAFWAPTSDNSILAIHPTDLNPSAYAPPAQFHWWEHMLTLGGTWHPDAAKLWAVSALNHYEISQSFDSPIGVTTPGQLFTTEWGVSRVAGKYFEFGMVGNYSHQTTPTRIEQYYPESYTSSTFELGPEIKVKVPQCDFSASLRYLREMKNPDSSGDYDLNVIVLSLSKRF